jgi:predicted membrane channel-forming protein YqfA (hemolysin III family)
MKEFFNIAYNGVKTLFYVLLSALTINFFLHIFKGIEINDFLFLLWVGVLLLIFFVELKTHYQESKRSNKLLKDLKDFQNNSKKKNSVKMKKSYYDL